MKWVWLLIVTTIVTPDGRLIKQPQEPKRMYQTTCEAIKKAYVEKSWNSAIYPDIACLVEPLPK